MEKFEFETEADSPYLHDLAPGVPMSKRIGQIGLIATGAIVSAAFGLQVVGPALAQVVYPKSQLSSAMNAVQSNSGTAAQIGGSSSLAPGVSNSVVSGNPLSTEPVNLVNSPVSEFNNANLAPNSAPISSGRSTSTLQAPTFSNTTHFGNVSSSTPGGGSIAGSGSVASGSSSGTFRYEKHEYESESHGERESEND